MNRMNRCLAVVDPYGSMSLPPLGLDPRPPQLLLDLANLLPRLPLGKLRCPRVLDAPDGSIGLAIGKAIGACVKHAVEVANAVAEHVKIDAVVLIVVVVVGSGGGGGGGGGSQWGPRCCICRRVCRRCRDRHPLLSLGGAGVHKLDSPQDRRRGAVAVAVDGGGAAATRQLVL